MIMLDWLQLELNQTVITSLVSKWFGNARWSLHHPANNNSPARSKTSLIKESKPQEQSKSPKTKTKRNPKLDVQNQTSVETSAAKNNKIEKTSTDSPKPRTRSQSKSREATTSPIHTRQRKK
ncbi:hypothetical protein Scep_001061 [Stephania cephalantha]|uniref:Uncharacterized protein n=1 Tax=Stephania cephalantha TaxID=152367 RepID=A0AAP0L9Z9_9MAGN